MNGYSTDLQYYNWQISSSYKCMFPQSICCEYSAATYTAGDKGIKLFLLKIYSSLK